MGGKLHGPAYSQVRTAGAMSQRENGTPAATTSSTSSPAAPCATGALPCTNATTVDAAMRHQHAVHTIDHVRFLLNERNAKATSGDATHAPVADTWISYGRNIARAMTMTTTA